MSAHLSSRARRATIGAAAVVVTSALLLSGCASDSTAPKSGGATEEEIAAALEKPSELTIWSWSANVEAGAEEFMKQYPNIDVEVVNVGTGADHYTKLQNVIKAGSGIPDIATVEYNVLPQFALSGDLADLNEFGYDSLESEFTASTWGQVNVDGGLYALPRGAGPMALFYNATVFDRLSLDVPTTWDEYRAAAEAIHAADPNAYIAADTGDAGFTNSMIWAAGGHPYSVDGENLAIDFSDEGTEKFADFWNGMISDGLLGSDAAWSSEWFQGLTSGTIATLTTGAWMAGSLASGAPDAAGNWRVAPMPTFEKGEKASAENGGGGDAILEKSDNKLVAAAFLKWMNVTDGPAISTKLGFFPAQTAVQESPEWLNTKSDFFGGQEINKVFAQSAADVLPDWQYLPYNAYASSVFNDYVGGAYTGDESLGEGLEAWGVALGKYGTEQGFSLK